MTSSMTVLTYRGVNAVAESFFATIKRELIDTRAWPSRADLRAAVFDYIEGWYNTRRLHSSLGYMSPALDVVEDRKSTRLNSSHTEIYTLSLHDALPISRGPACRRLRLHRGLVQHPEASQLARLHEPRPRCSRRSEEHTSELQSHRDLHSFPTRRSSDLARTCVPPSSTTSRAGTTPGGFTARSAT